MSEENGGRLEVQVDPLRAEVELLRVEADLLSAEADPLHAATILMIGESYAPEAGRAADLATAVSRDLAATAERVVVFTGSPVEARSGRAVLRLRPRRTRIRRFSPAAVSGGWKRCSST